jgi:hypothetical protein
MTPTPTLPLAGGGSTRGTLRGNDTVSECG